MGIEYSDSNHSARIAAVLRSAPQVFVDSINDSRQASGLNRIEVRGKPNTEGDASQLAENHKALVERRIHLLRQEAAALLD